MDYILRCMIGLNLCALVTMLGSMLAATLAGAPAHLNHKLLLEVSAFWATGLVGMTVVRFAALASAGKASSHNRTYRNFIVIGAGSKARRVASDRLSDPEQKYHLLGYLDSEPQRGFIPEGKLLGDTRELERILSEQEVDEVLITLPMHSQHDVIGEIIATCQKMNVRSQYFSDAPSLISFD